MDLSDFTVVQKSLQSARGAHISSLKKLHSTPHSPHGRAHVQRARLLYIYVHVGDAHALTSNISQT